MKHTTLPKVSAQFSGNFYTQESETNEVLFVRYENLSDLISDCEANRVSGAWTNKLFIGSVSTHFTFGKDYPTLELSFEAMRKGLICRKYLDQIEVETSKLLDANPELYELFRSASQYRRKRKFAEAGDELDIDRYMGGEVECWQTSPRQLKKNAIKIFIAGGLSSGEDAQKFVNNMVQFSVMCDVFQRMGVGVEVNVGKASQMQRRQFIVESTLIKEASSPLDVSRLMTSGLPAMFRYLSFYLKENFCKARDYGLGMPVQQITKDIEIVKEFAGYDIILTGQNSSNIVGVIHETIKKITV